MFHTIVLAIGGQTWLVVLYTLFKLIPIWPAVSYRVVLQNIKSLYVFLISLIGKTMKCLTTIFLCKLLYIEYVVFRNSLSDVRLTGSNPNLSLLLHKGQHTIISSGKSNFSEPYSVRTIWSALAPGCARFQYLNLVVLCCDT